MNKILVGLSCSISMLLSACGDDKTPDKMVVDDMVAATGPSFDLLSTPVGTVNFPNSCNAEASPLIERGVALMHHMMFDEAKFAFSMADDKDPNCAMAYWGQSMALIHPLWPDAVTPANYQRGLEWVIKAQSFEDTTEREKDYFTSTEAYFSDGGTLNVKQRYAKMSQIWNDISKKYPEDKELQIAGLIHDLGKVLFSYGEPSYSVVGDTYVVGCKYPDTI
ncbi:MAG: inositol oxygenase family protein, partial [Emcibacteraceae bacterium]|nr:inositol oxygenase family protein [Emcibacteraceae bacterium]